jgi:hypothetical protein
MNMPFDRVPRYNKAKQQNAMSSSKDSSNGLVQFSTSSPALRYSSLPDFNSEETDEMIINKLNERFEVLRLMTQDAIAGEIRAMIVSGPGGVGKTFTIDAELKKWDPDGENYTTSSGYMRTTGLYKMLYKHRRKGDIIKLDDMDSVFYDENSLNFIKIATDTTQNRILTYAAETKLEDEETGELIPRSFEYHGTMLFITNLDFDAMIDKGNKLSPHLQALVTRSHYIDLMMKTKRDYLIRVFQVAEEGLFDSVEGGLTDEEMDDVLNFIDKYHRNLRECSLRMALKVANLRKAAHESDSVKWERKALLTCCKGVL